MSLTFASIKLEKGMQSDIIDDTVSYADLYQIISEEMGKTSHLLEHLAHRILKSIENKFGDSITKCDLKICKLHPPIDHFEGNGVCIHVLVDFSNENILYQN